jgi:hypothetical protein
LRGSSSRRTIRIASSVPAVSRRPEGAEEIDVARARDGIADPRTVALHEVELEPHADEGRKDVREHDRRIETERVDREERHLRGELRRCDELEQRVLLAERAVLGLIATACRRSQTGVRSTGSPRRLSGRRLCHATRPTKNGPRRSRWSEVCFVLRMR